MECPWYEGGLNPTKTNTPRKVGIEPEIFGRLVAWVASLPNSSAAGWVFPSERIVAPLLLDNLLRPCIYPWLEPLGLDWINFAALRRSHSTLHKKGGTDPKIIAD